jgi:hypothetical protein
MKEGSLFDLFFTLKYPKPWCVLPRSSIIGKFSMNKGVSSWFHNVSTYSEEGIENNL